MTTTTTSPVQDITQAEEEAKQRTQEAKESSQKEVEVFRVAESERIDERKNALKKEVNEELKKEKEELSTILKKGTDDLKIEKEQLHAKVKKNEGGIVQFLVETFFALK